MSASASLHRALRKVNDFRNLPGEELNTIIDQMSFKEYVAGEVLWRTNTHLDFLGIIQNGEIIVQRQINGRVIRSIKLSAGDIVQPHDFSGENGRASILARAVTDVRFGVLRANKINTKSNIYRPKPRHFAQRLLFFAAWMLVIALIALMVSWQDVSRIASGLLFFESKPTNQLMQDFQGSVKLLSYAETIDRTAVFAHNQEGFLWYEGNDLQNAESAFTRAVNIDKTNGPGLNNLAVTYFAAGQIQQAADSQKNAAQNDPNSAITHYNMGIILMRQNYYEEAVREFKEAINIDPSWALPHLQQGFDYLQLRDYANAEKAATVTLQLDPTQQSAYVILAISLYNQGRNKEALRSIDGALQIEPSDKAAMFYKALILKRLEEFDPALGILDQLLASAIEPRQISRINAEIEDIHRILQNRQIGQQ